MRLISVYYYLLRLQPQQPSEEADKTDNPTRSWIKTGNPTPLGMPTTFNPTTTIYNPTSSPLSFKPTLANVNPTDGNSFAPVPLKIEEDVVKVNTDIIVKPFRG